MANGRARVEELQCGDQVVDLVSGFAGQIVQEQRFLNGPTRMVVAQFDLPVAKRAARELRNRTIPAAQLRRIGAARCTRPASAEGARFAVLDALWTFAANCARTPEDGGVATRDNPDRGLSLNHLDSALNQILAGLGYVGCSE